MKKRVRFVIGFATLVAAGCTVKVNGQVHKFGVSGEEEKKTEGSAAGGSGTSGSGTSGGSANPDELAAELAGGTTPAGQSVTLKTDFAPNPTVVGTFSTKAVDNVYEQPHGVSRCSGHVGDQATAVIKLTSAMKNTRISAPGARLILAELGNRQYTCDEGSSDSPPSVMLDEWPAGDVTIFVGGRKDETYTYELRVEDEKRPIDVAWKNNKATEINEVPKDAIVLTQTTPTTAGRKGSRCGNAYFRDVPDVVFSLKRPLGDMSIEVRSPKGIDVELVGPLNETGRNLPVNCGNDNRIQYNRMEAGIYGLRVGTAASGEESLFHVVVRSKDTARNPTMVPSKFADKIALEESVVTWHYPQLAQQDMDNDANREAIFLSAPKELFVFPKFNMDSSVAELAGAFGSSERPRDKSAPAPEYPKENEPLLLLNKSGLVVAADGAMFRINMKDIQADPTGAISLPAKPRNTWMRLGDAIVVKGPEDEKAYAAWQKSGKDIDACEQRARNNIETTFEALCGPVVKAAEKKKEALAKDLEKTRTARRAASLTKIKTRVEALFKK